MRLDNEDDANTDGVTNVHDKNQYEVNHNIKMLK